MHYALCIMHHASWFMNYVYKLLTLTIISYFKLFGDRPSDRPTDLHMRVVEGSSPLKIGEGSILRQKAADITHPPRSQDVFGTFPNCSNIEFMNLTLSYKFPVLDPSVVGGHVFNHISFLPPKYP